MRQEAKFLTRETTPLCARLYVEGDPQNLRLINDYFKTISSRFWGSYINIFHEKEIQTVIFRGCMDLYLNWFSSYSPKRENFRFRFLLNL